MPDQRITADEAEALRRLVVCDDRCEDPSMHEHFTSGTAFVWCWPKFDRLNPADKHTRAGLNRYPHNVIGAYVVIFGRGFGLRWKGSPRRRPSRDAASEGDG